MVQKLATYLQSINIDFEQAINQIFKTQISIAVQDLKALETTDFFAQMGSLSSFYAMAANADYFVFGFDRDLLLFIASEALGCDKTAFIKSIDKLSLFEKFVEEYLAKELVGLLKTKGFDLKLESKGNARKWLQALKNAQHVEYVKYDFFSEESQLASMHFGYPAIK